MTPGRRSANPSKNVPGDKAKSRSGSVTTSAEKPAVVAGEISAKDSGKQVKAAAPVVPHPGGRSEPGKAGRPFWSGSITIGLVNVPVRLHTMVRDRSVSFRLLHKADGQPLRYDRVCTKDDRVIPWAETVKGYEVRKGEFLVFEPEELKAIMPESNRKIRIEKFVFYLSLDPVYFDTSYFLTPDRSEEAYSLLVTALQDLGRAAIGTITLRTKEYPVVVHAYGGWLVLTTLRYADEVTLPQAFETLTDLPAPKEAELYAGETDYHRPFRGLFHVRLP